MEGCEETWGPVIVNATPCMIPADRWGLTGELLGRTHDPI